MLLSEFAAPTGVMPVSISMDSPAISSHAYGLTQTSLDETVTPDLPTSPLPTKFADFIGPDLPTSPPPTK